MPQAAEATITERAYAEALAHLALVAELQRELVQAALHVEVLL